MKYFSKQNLLEGKHSNEMKKMIDKTTAEFENIILLFIVQHHQFETKKLNKKYEKHLRDCTVRYNSINFQIVHRTNNSVPPFVTYRNISPNFAKLYVAAIISEPNSYIVTFSMVDYF